MSSVSCMPNFPTEHPPWILVVREGLWCYQLFSYNVKDSFIVSSVSGVIHSHRHRLLHRAFTLLSSSIVIVFCCCHVQALHHGAHCTVAYTSGAAVLGRSLPTSLRHRFSAASQVRQSTTPGPSATPVANVRPTGFLYCWPVSLELIAWQS